MTEYWKYATQSDTILPVGGGYWRGDYPTKMKHHYNIKAGDGPFPTDYVYVKDQPRISSPPSTTNCANYRNLSAWNSINGMPTTVGTNGNASYYGTFDQSGNVSEWIYGNKLNNKYVLRGGNFGSVGPKPISNRIRIVNSENRIICPLFGIGFRVGSINNPYAFPNFASVANPSNIPDPFQVNNLGATVGDVNYSYSIGRFTITNIEYIEFLESVASREDTYGVFNTNLSSIPQNGILRISGSSYFRYVLKSSAYRNKPVVNIDWPQAIRFCNWLHNNKPQGFQSETTTEDGAYSILGKFNNKFPIIENVGSVVLSIHTNNTLRAGSTTITYGGQPVLAYDRSWDFLAAENIDGTNKMVLRYKGSEYPLLSGFISVWTLNSSWGFISASDLLNPNNSNSYEGKTFSDIESDFSMTFTQEPPITRKTNALYFIPTEDEWYKAAFFNPLSNTYSLFATGSNRTPVAIKSTINGDGPFPTTYVFNYIPIYPHPLDNEDDPDPTPAPQISSINYSNGAKWDNRPRNITTVGSNGSPSFYGTYDQSGNVQEYMVTSDTMAVYRGGSHSSVENNNTFDGIVCSSTDRSLVPVRQATGGFRLVTRSSLADGDLVNIGNINNQPDESTGYGLVSHEYRIGKYPITVCEYIEFLNAVGRSDRDVLFNRNISAACRIVQAGRSGSFTYRLSNQNYSNKPIAFVPLMVAARYCNWLYNQKPEGNISVTDGGVYNISSSFGSISIDPGIDLSDPYAFFIPTENEWYKAAFYDPTSPEPENYGVYSKYANGSDDLPIPVGALSNGDGTLDNTNPARNTDFVCNT